MRQARKHITPDEFRRLLEAAGHAGRNTVRDKCLLQFAYYHGLRVAELTRMSWPEIDWHNEQVFVSRVKNGRDGVHPIQGGKGQELRVLRQHWRDSGEPTEGYIFKSERGGPLSPDMVARIVARAGVIAGLGYHVHPHMLRHGTGFNLVNRKVDLRTIQQYLGHSQIASTVIYTHLDSTRFRGIMKD